MSNNTDTIYDLSCSDLPAMPLRSRLYHLEPIGVGTPDVESLSSHTSRLAQAHGVRVRTLIEHEILPKCLRPYLAASKHGHGNALGNFLLQTAQSVNGTQAWANDWVRVLQSLTLRNDLQFLTMLTWADILNPQELLRRTKTWCPACYDEWQRDGQVIYEPLLWMLAVVTVCPRHSLPLRLRCPHKNCQQSMPVLAQRSRPGYCSRCEGWLGVPREIASADNTVLATDELEWQAWVAGAVGELIASAPSLPLLPRRERIMNAITIYAERVAGGDLFELSCLLQIDLPMLRSWQCGLKVPQLSVLLRLCYVLGITPLRFLSESTVSVEPIQINTPIISNTRNNLQTIRRPFNSQELQQRLEEILAKDEDPPTSMRQIAQRLKYHHSHLLTHFPVLCKAISARYLTYRKAKGEERRKQVRAQIRQAVFVLHDQGVYPSIDRIRALLNSSWLMCTPEEQIARREALLELGIHREPIK